MAKKETGARKEDNPMRRILINKLVINIGTGNDEKQQANAKKLLQQISGFKPADSISTKRIPSFKISKGAKIGAFVTVRNESARKLAKKLFEAAGNKVAERSIQDNTVNFGIQPIALSSEETALASTLSPLGSYDIICAVMDLLLLRMTTRGILPLRIAILFL